MAILLGFVYGTRKPTLCSRTWDDDDIRDPPHATTPSRLGHPLSPSVQPRPAPFGVEPRELVHATTLLLGPVCMLPIKIRLGNVMKPKSSGWNRWGYWLWDGIVWKLRKRRPLHCGFHAPGRHSSNSR